MDTVESTFARWIGEYFGPSKTRLQHEYMSFNRRIRRAVASTSVRGQHTGLRDNASEQSRPG
jgi:hypothetical protein